MQLLLVDSCPWQLQQLSLDRSLSKDFSGTVATDASGWQLSAVVAAAAAAVVAAAVVVAAVVAVGDAVQRGWQGYDWFALPPGPVVAVR